MFKRKNEIPEASSGTEEGRRGLFSRMKQGLAKTRGSFTEGLARLVAGKKQIDDELLEELETLLITADVGVEVTTEIIDAITERVKRRDLDDPEALVRALRGYLVEAVSVPGEIPEWRPGEDNRVVLVVGVNGVGKTTTIGKLAARYQQEGLSVMLAAGDTFRAAAVEQLQQWGQRCDCPVVAQDSGADSASVIHDAVQAAASRGTDVLLADTAGRLHTKTNLMEELTKVRRVVNRLDGDAPHETWLVVDATTGQNAVAQAEKFNESVPLTGLVVTKLDGTAKGGIAVSLVRRLGLPIRYIGVGEGLEDLRPFDPEAYVDALLDTEPAGTDAAP
ncbi:signal recognition particle-docking protein FtsY [Thiohalorhabdus methylotrophus]|uniref:Signal recognition particle receptor FtsY n=1 Tax=Thiohalorhabdus methylotrophus TaxID=3242694 RepID=A0ABV4TVN3_9GAMM